MLPQTLPFGLVTTRPRTAPTPGGLVRTALRHFDRLLDGMVAVFGVLYALQTADSFVADLPSLAGQRGTAVLVLEGAGIAAGLGALVLPALARAAFLTGAALAVAALLLWPVAVRPPVPTDPMPLVVALWPITAVQLTQAMRSRIAPVAIGAACSVVAVLTLHFRGGLSVADAVIDGLFMVGISGVLVLLLGTVRRGITSVAARQQAALDDFAAATAEDATEQERTRTDALLHDAVLTTFLSAAVADTPEAEDLASRMAGNSLRVLMHVNGIGRDERAMPFGRAVVQQRDRLTPLLDGFDVGLSRTESIVLPETVARAVVDVMLEAMEDRARRAPGAVRRSVHGDRLGPDGIRLVIADEAYDDEVGARWSFEGGTPAVAALRRVEGRVDARSAPGTGTSVQLSWGSVVLVGTAPLDDAERTAQP